MERREAFEEAHACALGVWKGEGMKSLTRPRHALLVSLGVALLTVPVSAEKPGGGPQPVTQLCTISGDIQSNGIVEVGAAVWTYELRDPITEDPTTLHLSQNLLRDEFGNPYADPWGNVLTTGSYYGQARVITRWEGRIDFDFGFLPCESPAQGEMPPYWVDGDGFCPYSLLVLNGVYDRKADRMDFDSQAAVVSLADNTLGPPCDVSPNDPDCVPTGGYWVGAGPLSDFPGMSIQFYGDGDGGDESGPEKTQDACTDGADNDGDGLVDCEDPNCKKWCP